MSTQKLIQKLLEISKNEQLTSNERSVQIKVLIEEYKAQQVA